MTERRILTEARGNRVLVTGAGGFIGGSVVRALVAGGWEVHGVVTAPPARPRPGVVLHTADLLAPGASRSIVDSLSPSHLIHLAWAPNRGVYRSLANFRWVEASLELLRVFAAAGGRRAVFVGSCAEYEWGGDQPLGEAAPLSRSTPYAAAKSSLGSLFLDFCAFTPLSGAWARPFFLFGPGEPAERLVPSVIKALLAGEPALCTHGEQVRDYLYVRDAADALVALLDGEVEGAVNVASGEGVRLADLVTAIAQRMDGEELVRLGAREAPPGEAATVVAAVDRLRDEVGWRPARDRDAALAETIEWWVRRTIH